MKAEMGGVAQEDLKYHVENFIMSVFAKTDKDERTVETITKQNAIDFKRTGDFIALLELFDGAMTPEWAERKKYCIFKAGTILKALKAGIQPERGNPNDPPEEEKKEEVASEIPSIPWTPIASVQEQADYHDQTPNYMGGYH